MVAVSDARRIAGRGTSGDVGSRPRGSAGRAAARMTPSLGRAPSSSGRWGERPASAAPVHIEVLSHRVGATLGLPARRGLRRASRASAGPPSAITLAGAGAFEDVGRIGSEEHAAVGAYIGVPHTSLQARRASPTHDHCGLMSWTRVHRHRAWVGAWLRRGAARWRYLRDPRRQDALPRREPWRRR